MRDACLREARLTRHSAQFTIFASFVSFALVFRTNMSIGRYWEARTFVETMRNRLAEACMQLIHFDEGAAPGAEYSDREKQWRAKVIHLFSLMHSVACQHLRDDLVLSNLRSVGEMVVSGTAPDAPQVSGCVRRTMSNFNDLFIDSRSAAAAPPDSVRVNPSVLLPAPSPHQEKSLGILPLSQMFLPRRAKATAQFNSSAPLPVIGGVSDEERAALEATHARVRLVQSWIMRAMAERMSDGGLLIGTRFPPTPILSRTYQLISEGTLAFSQARKICETPFPWPHAHLLELALVCFSFVMPLCMVAWMAELWSAVLLDAIVVFSFTAMNEVAIELEDPFVNQPHAIALATLQAHFNEELCCYGYEYALLAQLSTVGASGVGVLPPAAARAAAAAQRAQGGGPGLAVKWAGSTYASLRCYLLPASEPSDAAPGSPKPAMRFFT